MRGIISVGVLAIACGLAQPAAMSSLEQSADRETTAPRDADKVELNTADQAALETLPGIGPRTAERIIEYRTENGGFEKTEELMNVRGIGERTFLRLRDLVEVRSPAARQ